MAYMKFQHSEMLRKILKSYKLLSYLDHNSWYKGSACNSQDCLQLKYTYKMSLRQTSLVTRRLPLHKKLCAHVTNIINIIKLLT